MVIERFDAIDNKNNKNKKEKNMPCFRFSSNLPQRNYGLQAVCMAEWIMCSAWIRPGMMWPLWKYR